MDVDEEDDKILKIVADGGSLDYSIWPQLVSRLIPRIEQIAHNVFPIPPTPHSSSPHPLSSLQPLPSTLSKNASQSGSVSSQNTAFSSQSADKENAPPIYLQPANPNNDETPNTLPAQVVSLLNSITETLTAYFSVYPPHTVQRLAELVLAPKNHYRTLVSYLHAVDRVVHVTSGANIYPLPAAVQDPRALPNGTANHADPSSVSWGNSSIAVPNFGSDESLGGALLTPIPWLRPQNQSSTSSGNNSTHLKELSGELKTESTETIDGPNGTGSIETVSISMNGISSVTLSSTANKNDSVGSLRAEGGVTQGELLRQEQRAGVVPAAQLAIPRGPGDVDGMNSEDDEMPHARGPEEIGLEDTGPQAIGNMDVIMRGIDVEAAVGRRAEEAIEEVAPITPKREADEELGSGGKRMKDEASLQNELQGEDENMALAGANGKQEMESESVEKIGADASAV